MTGLWKTSPEFCDLNTFTRYSIFICISFLCYFDSCYSEIISVVVSEFSFSFFYFYFISISLFLWTCVFHCIFNYFLLLFFGLIFVFIHVVAWLFIYIAFLDIISFNMWHFHTFPLAKESSIWICACVYHRSEETCVCTSTCKYLPNFPCKYVKANEIGTFRKDVSNSEDYYVRIISKH